MVSVEGEGLSEDGGQGGRRGEEILYSERGLQTKLKVMFHLG